MKPHFKVWLQKCPAKKCGWTKCPECCETDEGEDVEIVKQTLADYVSSRRRCYTSGRPSVSQRTSYVAIPTKGSLFISISLLLVPRSIILNCVIHRHFFCCFNSTVHYILQWCDVTDMLRCITCLRSQSDCQCIMHIRINSASAHRERTRKTWSRFYLRTLQCSHSLLCVNETHLSHV